VQRRISDMSEDIELQLLQRLKETKFAIQLDETTDVAGESQFLVYVRYCFEKNIIEDFLFCKSVPTRTTGEEIFKILNDFFTSSELNWSHCTGICTDGAASMTGRKSGLVARVRNVSPNIMSTHCMIHREALASKKLSEPLNQVLNDSIKIVNFIKARPLNSRLFTRLCEETGSEFKHLLLHAEVRWLSRGKVVQRLFQLRHELLVFLTDHDLQLATHLADNLWLAKLAYLADIFNHLNALNASLQGKDSNILKTTDKVSAFKKKLSVWKGRLQERSADMFELFTEFLNENDMSVNDLSAVIIDHLTSLADYFETYFPTGDIADYDWIRNPFICQLTELTGREQEQLAELSSDRTLEMNFKQQTLDTFWCSVVDEYPLLGNKALTVLLPFATTYLCEVSFSALANMKTKFRSRLNVENDLRVSLSQIEPRIELLCQQKQAHLSH
jgi:hypothetical protein